MDDETTTVERRMEVFAALVAAQDQGASVATSRHLIARRYGMPVEEIAQIESEGIDQQWPPLG